MKRKCDIQNNSWHKDNKECGITQTFGSTQILGGEDNCVLQLAETGVRHMMSDTAAPNIQPWLRVYVLYDYD